MGLLLPEPRAPGITPPPLQLYWLLPRSPTYCCYGCQSLHSVRADMQFTMITVANLPPHSHFIMKDYKRLGPWSQTEVDKGRLLIFSGRPLILLAEMITVSSSLGIVVDFSPLIFMYTCLYLCLFISEPYSFSGIYWSFVLMIEQGCIWFHACPSPESVETKILSNQKIINTFTSLDGWNKSSHSTTLWVSVHRCVFM